ncbi:TatD family hydrolase [Mariprofundus sp. NF]|uniref:TatD family hydrolase n=1 Tax=Mariprofundus sp. NF TaxID=2608716 RepID=UPI001642D944|nr:TatD family hydrolase [Mariprofundus sp. NF]
MIDSHCHLDDLRFDQSRVAVLQRAQDAGVTAFIVPAVCRSGWPKLQHLALDHSSISPAFGLHPWFCNQHSDSDLSLLPQFLADAVAVGECGLDGSDLCRFDMDSQLHWFQPQLQLALEHDLPVIVHAFRAVDDVIREIRQLPGLRGVIHSFSGSQQQADQLVKLGFYLGFGGAVTYPRASRVQGVVKHIPLEKLLIETDAPDQSPAAHRGGNNEPAFLIEILAQIATLRGTDSQALAAICNHNARELFRL